VAEESYPFSTSQVATEDQWSRMARMFCPDGVAMASPADPALKVTANGTSSVSVAAGEAMVNGFKYRLTAPKSLTVPTNFGNASPRVDLVVLRCSQTANTCVATYRTGGTFAPALATDRNDVFDVPIAQVTVAAGSTVAASGAVVDRRYPPSRHAAFGNTPNTYAALRYDGGLYVGDGTTWHQVPLLDVPRCKAYQSGTGEVLPDDTAKDLVLNAEEWDSAGMHTNSGDPANRKVTVPIAGIYSVLGSVAFDSDGVGLRDLAIVRNGTTAAGGNGSSGIAVARSSLPAASSGETSFQCGAEVALDAGDRLCLRVTQTSGGFLGMNPGQDRVFLQVRWLRPS
jgi:hypothetical protein